LLEKNANLPNQQISEFKLL